MREVRVVTQEGEQLGIFPIRDALRLAAERNLDLVEVAPSAKPPVCRIMDYGRFRYEQAKKDRDARKKQHQVTIKEVKLRPRIEEHDFEVKARNAERFLKDGDRVKATIMFRGREIVHSDLGREVLDRLVTFVQDVAIVERPARVEGRNMTMFLVPKDHSTPKGV
ncbi:MAG: translation initiation factor IF-3 [Thermaerobacter sp.]|nr:translation initiation factor IF-3 [Thermaerobacter sp.]